MNNLIKTTSLIAVGAALGFAISYVLPGKNASQAKPENRQVTFTLQSPSDKDGHFKTLEYELSYSDALKKLYFEMPISLSSKDIFEDNIMMKSSAIIEDNLVMKTRAGSNDWVIEDHVMLRSAEDIKPGHIFEDHIMMQARLSDSKSKDVFEDDVMLKIPEGRSSGGILEDDVMLSLNGPRSTSSDGVIEDHVMMRAEIH